MSLSDLPLAPCSFCHEVEQAAAGHGLAFAAAADCIALPTLGCFVPGYSLVVPQAHITSFADIDEQDIEAVAAFVEEVRTNLSVLFPGVMLAEHGTGAPDEPTAACCVHAHIHCIPVGTVFENVVERYVAKGGVPATLSSIGDLRQFRGRSYLTISISPGHWMVWPDASRFPRQFVRRAVAEALNCPECFDWRRFPFPEKMNATAVAMRHVYRAKRSAVR